MAGKRLEMVYGVLDKIEKPTGEKRLFIPRTKDGRTILYLDQGQMSLLGQEISKQVFGSTNEEYRPLQIQRIYESTDEELKKVMDNNDVYIIARELIIDFDYKEYDFNEYTEGVVISDPHVIVTDDEEIELIIDGVSVSELGGFGRSMRDASIYNNDVAKTLESAGAFKKSGIPLESRGLVRDIIKRKPHAIFGAMTYPSIGNTQLRESLPPETKAFYLGAIPYRYPDNNISTQELIPTVAVFEKVSNKK